MGRDNGTSGHTIVCVPVRPVYVRDNVPKCPGTSVCPSEGDGTDDEIARTHRWALGIFVAAALVAARATHAQHDCNSFVVSVTYCG